MKLKQTFKIILSVILVFLVFLFLWNKICKICENPKLKNAYGRHIEVCGKNMCVDIQGVDNDTTVILIPGFGSASPVLEFKPLAEELSKTLRIITIEPFGYGLSDGTEKPRSIENVVEELHSCVLQLQSELGFSTYCLISHSLGGLYDLYWANCYPEEVQCVIGIDISVPHQNEIEPLPLKLMEKILTAVSVVVEQSGFPRLLSLKNHDSAVNADKTYSYSNEEIDIFRMLSIDNFGNKTVINEEKYINKNLETLKNMIFPNEIPVLLFVSRNNCEILPKWKDLHNDVIKNHDRKSKVIELNGSHYLHLHNRKEITENILAWMNQ